MQCLYSYIAWSYKSEWQIGGKIFSFILLLLLFSVEAIPFLQKSLSHKNKE